jgi:hypothetical protein
MRGADQAPEARRTRPRRSLRRGAGAARDPVVVILVLAGIFDWLSGNGIHSLVLFSAAVALTWNGVTARTRGAGVATVAVDARLAPSLAPGTAPTFLFLAAAVPYALVVGGFARYSWPATLAVLVPGAVAIVLAWRGPLRPGAEPRRLHPAGVIAWASLFVAVSLWELTSLLLQPSLTTGSYDHPTISVMMDPVLAHHPGRTVVLFLWLVGGWFLVQR